MQNFIKHIKDFNDKHPEAIALNFREPGRNFNKLKLWDDSIIIDENLFLKIQFLKRKECVEILPLYLMMALMY